jgi:histidyl-tRNA synthetase
MPIQPRTLKGFRDFLPKGMLHREWVTDVARNIYRQYGFTPIDTPALELLEILLGKGSEETDRQLYQFQDNGGRMVGMRFDLTVPLARFVAQHRSELTFPFKRYHIAKVWRGENTSHGRYREFMQCDFDTIGTTELTADIEMVQVIHDLMHALGVQRFTIHVNHRGILHGVLERAGLLDKSALILRSLDKLGKIGVAAVSEEMQRVAEVTPQEAGRVLTLAEISGDTRSVIAELPGLVAGSARGEKGAADLQKLQGALEALAIPLDAWKLDLSIARGLDYYSGIVLETTLNDLPSIGSVCSGGRYDDLASVYTTEKLPGIGASLGLDRILTALEELQQLPDQMSGSDVLVVYFDAGRLHDYLRMAAKIRRAGVSVQLYPEPKKLGQQLKYADALGIKLAVIAGDDEFAKGQCQIKDLRNRTSIDVSLDEGQIAAAVKSLLSR